MYSRSLLPALALLAGLLAAACSDANDEQIGGECADSAACANDELTCLTQFKGGYCGAAGCAASADCPEGAACVVYEGASLCFLICQTKDECNANRSAANEANCSSTVNPIEGGTQKTCVPPSGT